MKDVSPDNSTIRMVGDFGGYTPETLFDYWVRPELLVKWWPREATVDARIGGIYKFSWPEQDWTLSGTYTAMDVGRHLGFTWSWNFDTAHSEPLLVDLTFAEIEGGTELTIVHGPWGEIPAAQTERQAVIEGWIHFGMRLAGLSDGEAI